VIDAGSGYLCQMEPVAHFGLGSLNAVDSVTVTWPDGASQTISNPSIDKVLSVSRPAGLVAPAYQGLCSKPASKETEKEKDSVPQSTSESSSDATGKSGSDNGSGKEPSTPKQSTEKQPSNVPSPAPDLTKNDNAAGTAAKLFETTFTGQIKLEGLDDQPKEKVASLTKTSLSSTYGVKESAITVAVKKASSSRRLTTGWVVDWTMKVMKDELAAVEKKVTDVASKPELFQEVMKKVLKDNKIDETKLKVTHTKKAVKQASTAPASASGCALHHMGQLVACLAVFNAVLTIFSY
jgi:hypothetical protein